MYLNRILSLLLSLFFLGFSLDNPLYAYADQANQSTTPINGTIAIVNNEVITRLELEAATDQAIAQAKAQGLTIPERISIERQVLHGLIMQKIALQLAKLNHISISNDELNAAIAQIAATHQVSVAEMYQKLQDNGANVDAFKTNINNQLIIRKLEEAAVGSSIVVTASEVDNYLANQSRLKNTNTEYNLAHILIALPPHPSADDYAKTYAKAQMVLDKINNGMPFSTAAMTYSDNTDALSGGDLGYKTLTQLPTSFIGAATSLPIGGVSTIISSDSGFNIVKLLDKKGGPTVQPHFITEYHVNAILIKPSPIMSSTDVQAELARIRLSLENNVPFAKLAEENSEDPLSNQNGGDLGWVNPITLNPILAAQIRSLPINTTSQPFQTPEGWYLIQVLGSRQVNDTVNYDREQAREAIFMEKANEALQAWQSQIRAASYIKILDPNLKMINT